MADNPLCDKLIQDVIVSYGFDKDGIWSRLKKNEGEELIAMLGMETFKNPKGCNTLAGAIRMWTLYKRAPTTLQGYIALFKERLRPDVLDFFTEHVDELSAMCDFTSDFTYGNLAASTLINSYLARVDGVSMEIPQFMILRVAVGASKGRGLDFIAKTVAYFNMRMLSFASPTLFNMGFIKGAPTSCMVMTMADDLKDIYDVLSEVAMASQNNAGIGLALNNIRHAEVGRVGDKGVGPLMKLLDHSVEYVNQGGRRPGAATVTLPVWHYDIDTFITIVDKVQSESIRVRKLNTSIMMNDVFMERVQSNDEWYCMCPAAAEGLVTAYGDEFRKLYLKYEAMAKDWEAWQRYQYLCKVYDHSQRSDIFEEIATLVERFESVEYAEWWFYQNAKADLAVGTPSALNRQLFRLLDGKYDVEPKRSDPPPKFRSLKYNARSIMYQICDQQRKSGMPYIIHGDTINMDNPNKNVGYIYSLNLCQEIALPTIPKEQTATCNIGAVCLKNMHKLNEKMEMVVDYKTLSTVVQHMTLMLNDILDHAVNIHPKAKASNDTIRAIGLGVNGWAELMYELDLTVVDIDSVELNEAPEYRYANDIDIRSSLTQNDKATSLINEIWSCIYYNALRASCDEAKRTEPYAAFDTSEYKQGILHFDRHSFHDYKPADPAIWDMPSWSDLREDIKKFGLRNSTVTAQMPTATSAQILEASESTEVSNNLIVRRLNTGDFIVQNYSLVDDLKRIGMWTQDVHDYIVEHDGSIMFLPEDEKLPDSVLDELRFFKEKYRTIWEVPQKFRIHEEAIRQVYTDQARSFNIYIEDPHKEVLAMVHRDIWNSGLKSSYYIRSRSALTNMKFGKKEEMRRLGAGVNDIPMCSACVL